MTPFAWMYGRAGEAGWSHRSYSRDETPNLAAIGWTSP
jgi:hypothetical protein